MHAAATSYPAAAPPSLPPRCPYAGSRSRKNRRRLLAPSWAQPAAPGPVSNCAPNRPDCISRAKSIAWPGSQEP
ncbi:hypothetical protein Y1Q_0000817 [Alligator mississippiensis]|uniref:Uncharacterized protein n=1 Tax=Alligator mississippiensis TaxID=8496 RepID=A0A151MVR8_ALLMI|nr:hypothetical protein Y1Q_0000817 [Alligator mississippiensis]